MHIGYNHEVVKQMSKEEFKKALAHHAKDTDLDADYEAIVGTKEKEEAPKHESKGAKGKK